MPDVPSDPAEQRLIELAQHYVTLFSEAASGIDSGTAWIAHALWVLGQVTEQRRAEWLKQPGNARDA